MKSFPEGALFYNFLCSPLVYRCGYSVEFLLAVRVGASLVFLYGIGMPLLSSFLLVLLR